MTRLTMTVIYCFLLTVQLDQLALANDSLSEVEDRISAAEQKYVEKQKQETRLKTQYDAEYNVWALKYTKLAYIWHFVSTVLIFLVVMFVVVSGVVLAAWQLRSWLARVKSYDDQILKSLASGKDVDVELVTGIAKADGGQVDLRKDALGVSSPYVGVVILGLSMGFFMAYLLLAYPIIKGP